MRDFPRFFLENNLTWVSYATMATSPGEMTRLTQILATQKAHL